MERESMEFDVVIVGAGPAGRIGLSGSVVEPLPFPALPDGVVSPGPAQPGTVPGPGSGGT